VTARVWKAGKWYCSVADTTAHKTSTKALNYRYASETSHADFIVERPFASKGTELADFGSVEFTHMALAPVTARFDNLADRWEMVNARNEAVAVPSLRPLVVHYTATQRPPTRSLSVSLATLCSNPSVQSNAVNGCPYLGSSQVGAEEFAHAILVEDNDESITPAFWDLFNFPSGTCETVRLSFGMPDNGSSPGDSASLRVKAGSLAPVSATVSYGRLGTLEASLDGQRWSLENSATNTDDKIAIDGTAQCSTSTGY
jgi:hypothetical protein